MVVRLSLSPDGTYQGAPQGTWALAEARSPLPGRLGKGLGCPKAGSLLGQLGGVRRFQVTELPLSRSSSGTQPEKQKPRAKDSQ